MAIDGCQRSFSQLAQEVLPQLMTMLRERMQDPVPLAEFATKGVGPVTMRQRLSLADDPRGCYVLLDADRPVYVGISKHVIQRLMEHMRGTDHLTATLAYRIACAQHPHTLTAAEAMKDPEFCSQFEAVKLSMATWSVAFVEVENPLELYLFEAYCAMELDTGFEAGGWNTFATH